MDIQKAGIVIILEVMIIVLFDGFIIILPAVKIPVIVFIAVLPHSFIENFIREEG